MFIKTIQIIHFKTFKNVTIHLNPGLNIFTGVNNSGKTTVLEAIALWHECFRKLLSQARTSRTAKNATPYRKGDYILGSPQNRHFNFDQIHSVRLPKFEDIFHQLEQEIPIQLIAHLERINEKLNTIEPLEIGFQIKNNYTSYEISLIGFQNYPFEHFNQFFDKFPMPIGNYFASLVTTILPREPFATPPNIIDALLRRNSGNVLRNKLYFVNHNFKANDFYRFTDDLNYILFDNRNRLDILSKSDIQRDLNVIFDFKVGGKELEKDIALLGSGTLQIMEILSNVYYRPFEANMNLILLDEPDSYIHRDIQRRLLGVLESHTVGNQIFMTTHSADVIRATATDNLFHIEQKPENIYQPIDNKQLIQLTKTGDKRFKGIYPAATNAVIRSLGHSSGLDFINAIEADYILFVEGEEDAQVLYLLLHRAIIPKNTKKYVFWVLNGINNVFKEIETYKRLFSQIKNEKSLWDKSVLIMDRDFLSDEHVSGIAQKMKSKLALRTYIADAYTLETTLLTDFEKFSRLLALWVYNKMDEKIDAYLLESQLEKAYRDFKPILEAKYLNHTSWKEDATQRYIDVRNRTHDLFGKGQTVIEQNDAKLAFYYQKHLEECIQRYDFHKLMNKWDVQQLINNVLVTYNHHFDIEKDFILLLAGVDRSTWFEAWHFLIDLSR